VPAIFTVDHVHWLLDLADELGIGVWIDGGWAVDALGKQTRAHADLDIGLPTDDATMLREALREQGFGVESQGYRPHNYVIEHDDGRRIDVHLFVVLPDGHLAYGGDESRLFPPAVFAATGSIGGRVVRCTRNRQLWSPSTPAIVTMRTTRPTSWPCVRRSGWTSRLSTGVNTDPT
jgi:lincosamide nucleotidyltransferase A/C/D/E